MTSTRCRESQETHRFGLEGQDQHSSCSQRPRRLQEEGSLGWVEVLGWKSLEAIERVSRGGSNYHFSTCFKCRYCLGPGNNPPLSCVMLPVLSMLIEPGRVLDYQLLSSAGCRDEQLE